VSPWLQAFLFGLFGGFAAEFLVYYSYRKRPPHQRPAFLRSWFYIVIIVVRIGIGGGLAALYAPLPKIAAFHIGASLPIIIQRFTRETPEPTQPAG
jgi:hypothetical protein